MRCIFFGALVPHAGCVPQQVEGNSLDKIRHLLGFIHHNWVSSFSGKKLKRNGQNETTKWRFIPSASEPKEAGVKLEKIERYVGRYQVQTWGTVNSTFQH